MLRQLTPLTSAHSASHTITGIARDLDELSEAAKHAAERTPIARPNATQASNEEHTVTQSENVLYTGRTHTTGGRDGASRSSDGRLDLMLSPPGTSGSGTNPEQLFAAGWSACFIGAMGHAARARKITLPAGTAVDAEVDLCNTDGAYFLQARLNVSLPGLEREVARALADAAHQTCPYSKATRGNIDVTINLV
jgi:lipoyl-dependent peroxiredoxin